MSLNAGPLRDRPLEPEVRSLIRILTLGALPPALDTTIVNVALASLGRGLHSSLATTQWTITGYLLAMGLAMPLSRWVAERYGRRQVWLGCIAVFLAGSVLAGAAWNIESLIVFRLVQGAAAGLSLPLVTAMTMAAAGKERRGRAAAIAMMIVVVVPIFGPIAGGLAVNYLGWRWVFYVNPPICLLALWLAWRRVPDSGRGAARSLDVLGVALLCPGLALVIYGFSKATAAGGFAATSAWVPLLLGALLSAAFAFHALGPVEDPLLDLRLLRIRSYAASTAVLFLSGFSVYGPLLLLSLYFQQVQGRSAVITGLLLAPQGIGSLIPRGIAGKLTDRIGGRPIAVVGLLLTALGTLPFVWSGPGSDEWVLGVALFVRGAGLAPVTIAAQAGAFRDVEPDDVPDASSLSRILQQLGGSFGAAVLALILAGALLSDHAVTAAGRGLAFDTAFWCAIGLTALTFVPALLLPAGAASNRGRDGPSHHHEVGPTGVCPGRAQERTSDRLTA